MFIVNHSNQSLLGKANYEIANKLRDVTKSVHYHKTFDSTESYVAKVPCVKKSARNTLVSEHL